MARLSEWGQWIPSKKSPPAFLPAPAEKDATKVCICIFWTAMSAPVIFPVSITSSRWLMWKAARVPPAPSAPTPTWAAGVCPVSLPVGGCPGRPAGSKSIWGADVPPKSATRKMRALRWGTPQYCASRVLQAREDPSPITAPAGYHFPPGGRGTAQAGAAIRTVSSRTIRKSSPSAELNVPGTFSHTMNLGRINSVDRSRC